MEKRFVSGRFPTLGPVAIILAAALLSACSAALTDQAISEVSSLTRERVGRPVAWNRSEQDRAAAEAEVSRILAEPVDADGAVAVALLNNPGLQADLAELGIAAAEFSAALRPPNPGFTYSRLSRGGALEIERGVAVNVLGLLALPVAASIEERRFEQAKVRTAREVLRLAAETRKAWYRAVTAQRVADYVAEAKAAAGAQAELGRRMFGVGNLSRLDYAREQALYAEIAVQHARASLAAGAERGRLARLLGLWGSGAQFRLPPQLPELPASAEVLADFEARAIGERLDLRMARAELDGLAKGLGLTRTTRFINVLETSYLRNRESGAERQTGYEIHFEVPLFDFGDARVAKAEALYLQAVSRLAEMAIDARSELREAATASRTAFDIARHYRDEVLPLRRKISEELQLRYNGMLVSVFELLADARAQIVSVVAAIEAEREFWLAEIDLRAAMAGGPVARSKIISALPRGAASDAGH